jgi:hypothetical protein
MRTKRRRSKPLSLADKWKIDSRQGLGWVLTKPVALKPLGEFLEKVLSGEIEAPEPAGKHSIEELTRVAIAQGYLAADAPFEDAVDRLLYALEHECDDEP